MARPVILALALPFALSLACEAERAALPPAGVEQVEYRPAQARTNAPESGELAGAAAEQVAAGDTNATPEPVGRKLIRTGSAGIEVKAVPAAVERVKAWVEEAGGYVGDESESEDGYGARTAHLTCRVPAEELERLVERLRQLGEVERVQLSAQDITEQYFDLEIRLANQKRLEARLLDLLERRSNELSDLLEIEREAARVRGEIEQLEGRRRFWDNQVALSTLQVELHEPRPAIAGQEGGAWRTLVDAFRRFADNFVLSVAGIIAVAGALIPVAGALGLLAWIFVAWSRRRRRRATEEIEVSAGGESNG